MRKLLATLRAPGVGLLTILVLGSPASLWAQEAGEESARPVAVVGEEGSAYRLQTRPGRIVLGKDQKITFLVEAPEPEGPRRPLRASVNVGQVGKIVRQKPGRYAVTYLPPKKAFPQVAILALWRETGIDASVAFFRIPLLGSAKIPIDAVPGATVVADVGGVVSAPVKAGPSGKVELKLVVPPGVPVALLKMSVPGEADRAGTYPLTVPPFNRMTMAAVPHAVPADGKSQARILVYYDAFGSKALDPKGLLLQANTGHLSPLAARGQLLASVWTAPERTTKAKVARFTAAAKPDPASQASAKIRLGPPAPSQVVVEAQPERILGDGKEKVSVTFHVLDEEGLGVSGLKVKVKADLPGTGGAAQGLTALGGGKYRFEISPITFRPKVRPDRPYHARLTVQAGEVVGEAKVRVDPWIPERVEVTPERLGLVADGRTRAALRVRVLDARGRIITGFPVEATASHGTLDAEPTRAPDGSLTYGYRPPRIEQTSIGSEGELQTVDGQVQVKVGDLESTVPLRLTPESRVVGGEPSFVEVAGGYGTNLGSLLGPRLRLAAGTRLLRAGRFLLELGAGLGGAQGSAALTWSSGSGGADGWLQVWEAWAQGELRLALVGTLWRVELVGAGGAGYLHTSAAWGGGEPATYQAIAPSVEGRLGFGITLGPGRISLSAGYARRLHEESAAAPTSGLALGGAVGGLFGTLGYRLEM
ncbi:MAG: Ig-like domain-containing protein [Deltaproteobacteria bacterium]|nr:Ig-like domain-containing protein [Deltaproteobacteria bacterium]